MYLSTLSLLQSLHASQYFSQLAILDELEYFYFFNLEFLILQKMVKTSKIQWRTIDIMSDSTTSNDDRSAVKPHSELHPFLKIISKKMDAIVKKNSTQTSDDSK